MMKKNIQLRKIICIQVGVCTLGIHQYARTHHLFGMNSLIFFIHLYECIYEVFQQKHVWKSNVEFIDDRFKRICVTSFYYVLVKLFIILVKKYLVWIGRFWEWIFSNIVWVYFAFECHAIYFPILYWGRET